jgi:LPXTG-motif cell wall-anchored protein
VAASTTSQPAASGPSPGLPATGADSSGEIRLALWLVLLGLGVIVLSRRRRLG